MLLLSLPSLEVNLMSDKMKERIEKARADAPPGIDCVEDTTTRIPDGHTHVLVEEFLDEGDNMLVKILATGDEIGMAWALGYAAQHYDTNNTIGIMDLTELKGRSEQIEFH